MFVHPFMSASQTKGCQKIIFFKIRFDLKEGVKMNVRFAQKIFAEGIKNARCLSSLDRKWR